MQKNHAQRRRAPLSLVYYAMILLWWLDTAPSYGAKKGFEADMISIGNLGFLCKIAYRSRICKGMIRVMIRRMSRIGAQLKLM